MHTQITACHLVHHSKLSNSFGLLSNRSMDDWVIRTQQFFDRHFACQSGFQIFWFGIPRASQCRSRPTGVVVVMMMMVDRYQTTGVHQPIAKDA
jgi:hypothetical protein